MTCPCDQHHCPTPMAIAAGLACLSRAPGQFPDWRVGLLAAVGREPALDAWRARESGDIGLMLVEMGAYVLDVASFYDQLVANDSYLGTAVLAGSQRRLVSLLGYRPRPGFGSSVWLEAEADGARVVKLPGGTAFRSGEFDGNPPQVFELQADREIDPRINTMAVQRVRATQLVSPLSSVLARAATVRVKAGDAVVIDCNGTLVAMHVASLAAEVLRIRDAVTRITFSTVVNLGAGVAIATTRLLKAGASAAAWKLTPAAGEPAVLDGTHLSLDGRYAIRGGEIVLLTDGSTWVACKVTAVSEVQYTLITPAPSKITDSASKVSTLESPPIKVSVTRLTFDSTLPFASASAAQVVLHHAMVEAATLHAPLKDTLAQGDPISVPGLIDPPRVDVTELMLEDVHGDGVVTTGTLDAAAHSASGDTSPAWGRELWAPVNLHGNVLFATRGESVKGELLGAGDASLPWQTFRLKKKPLTYLPAANAAGRASSLVVHVGGIRWQEVETFYGVDEHATVYQVQHDEDGNTDITFGGGSRLPSGAAVLADYRFGAGAALPPAGSVKQVAKPVAGLRKVHNALAAFGGSDAEGAGEIAVRGPASALLLGRAISLIDIEAAAGQQAGVRAARASWQWDALGLQPAVVVAYIGDPQIAPSLRAALRALAEDDAPISVKSAPAQAARLDVDIEIEPLRVPADVIAALGRALFAAVTLPGTGGLLRAERLGPDGVLFQSVLVRAVMEVPGVVALRTLAMDETPFVEVARQPATGAYFEFAIGGVWIDGVRA